MIILFDCHFATLTDTLCGSFPEILIGSYEYQALYKYNISRNALIFFSFGNGRSEKAVNSRSRRAVVFHCWIHTHRRFCVFYYQLENAANSPYGTEPRVSTLLVVRDK